MRTMGVVGVDTFDLRVGCMAAVSSAAPFLRNTSNSLMSGLPLAWPIATINMAAMSTNAAAFLWYLAVRRRPQCNAPVASSDFDASISLQI